MEPKRPGDIWNLVRNFFFRMVNKEFLIFLVFLLLSGAFWLLLTLNENYEREIQIPVRLEKIPRQVVITGEPYDTLRVTVRDRGFFIMDYIYGGSLAPVSLNFATYNKGNGKGSVSQSELQRLVYPQLYKSSRIVSIKPDRLEFTYNNGDSKRVPVKLDGRIVTNNSYYLARVAFNPEMVTLYASEEKLDSIQSVMTERVVLSNLTDTIVREVNLRKIQNVKCVPAVVKVTFYPDVLTEGTVDVPIVAVNMPPGKVLRTFPSKAKVRFTVGASIIRKIYTENFRVEVDYNDIIENPSDKCTLKLKSTPQGVRKANLESTQVDYLIEEQ